MTRASDGWTVSERWGSNRLKPYFNDLVVHRGHAYGFDGAILACLDLADGTRKWKGGRYGQGQLVLLEAQEVLVVLSEDGELARSRPVPTRSPSSRNSGTKQQDVNHPVLAATSCWCATAGDGGVPAHHSLAEHPPDGLRSAEPRSTSVSFIERGLLQPRPCRRIVLDPELGTARATRRRRATAVTPRPPRVPASSSAFALPGGDTDRR